MNVLIGNSYFQNNISYYDIITLQSVKCILTTRNVEFSNNKIMYVYFMYYVLCVIATF